MLLTNTMCKAHITALQMGILCISSSMRFLVLILFPSRFNCFWIIAAFSRTTFEWFNKTRLLPLLV